MAKKNWWCWLEKQLACKREWNRTILRWERSWKELNQFLDKKDHKKK